MKRAGYVLGALGGAVVLGGAAFVWLGVFNVSARNGHWPGVSPVLHAAFERSVVRRAPEASSVPANIDDEALAMLGAGHYEQACRQCHGAPDAPAAATIQQMSPRPPLITEAVEGWEPAQLFWILREGVKMSGMPAWPSARRADDVWAVVGFLKRVEDMDGKTYQRLLTQQTDTTDGVPAAETTVDSKAAIEGCVNCHAEDGRSHGNRHVPRLDLQNPGYLEDSLRAYRSGERYSGIMQQAASILSDDAIEGLAQHYGKSGTAKRSASSREASHSRQALIEHGRKLASAQENARDVPACEACHGPWPEPLSSQFPAIAGQHEGFLRAQLMSWKDGTRGGTELSRLMHQVVPELTASDMEALAAYYATLP